MRKLATGLAALALSLTLTACGGDDEEELPKDGLMPGEQTSETPPPEEPLPEPPVNTLEPDLTTPEGAITAYMVYLNLGDGDAVCALFTETVVKAYGGPKACPGGVQDYADAVLPAFEDNLDVAEAVKVSMQTKTAQAAKGSAAIVVNEAEGTMFFEGFSLEKQGDEWRISQLNSLTAQPTN